MAAEGKEASKPKAEAAVLSEPSLEVLAKELATDESSPVVLLMYLNIPTTTIINFSNGVSKAGLKGADNETMMAFTKKLLLYWKTMRAGAKDKDKVNDIERALKEMGKADIAEAFRERYSNNLELTPEAFAQ